jgi:hypothetical protein
MVQGRAPKNFRKKIVPDSGQEKTPIWRPVALLLRRTAHFETSRRSPARRSEIFLDIDIAIVSYLTKATSKLKLHVQGMDTSRGRPRRSRPHPRRRSARGRSSESTRWVDREHAFREREHEVGRPRARVPGARARGGSTASTRSRSESTRWVDREHEVEEREHEVGRPRARGRGARARGGSTASTRSRSESTRWVDREHAFREREDEVGRPRARGRGARARGGSTESTRYGDRVHTVVRSRARDGWTACTRWGDPEDEVGRPGVAYWCITHRHTEIIPSVSAVTPNPHALRRPGLARLVMNAIVQRVDQLLRWPRGSPCQRFRRGHRAHLDAGGHRPRGM